MRYATIFTLSLLFTCGLEAQSNNPWTLERAVTHALENNLQVKRLDNFAEIARIQLQQAKNSRLPTANGSSNVGAQLGRTIDPTTNEFEQQTIGFQGYQLNAGITLYQGGQIKNRLQQAKVDLAAAEMDTKVTGNNIGLQVASSYLNVLLFREQLANSRAQLELTQEQLANTMRLIEAGAAPEAQRFDLEAQEAANERAIVDLENQVDMAILGLKILLELDYNEEFDIITPDLNPSEAQLFENYALEEVFLSARGIQPTIAAAELRRESTELGIELAKAGMRPTISLFGSLSTNFSTAAKDFANPDRVPDLVIGSAIPVEIAGVPTTLAQFVPSFTPNFPTLGYLNQLDRNFGQSVGMSINVPIYSQGRNKLNVQQAKVQRNNAALDIELAENNLRNDVELALTNLRAAQQTYRAAQASEEAAQAAYDNTQRSFRAGAANSLDLVTATNRLDQAKTELTRSKYQLVFNRQVIRFYLGQGLSLD